MRFFHKYDTHKKNVNTIWELVVEEGIYSSSLPDMKRTSANFFNSIYEKPEGEDLEAQLKALKYMPRFFLREDNDEIWRVVTKKELEEVIKGMPKQKSLGPDGWTHELFMDFFISFMNIFCWLLRNRGQRVK